MLADNGERVEPHAGGPRREKKKPVRYNCVWGDKGLSPIERKERMSLSSGEEG